MDNIQQFTAQEQIMRLIEIVNNQHVTITQLIRKVESLEDQVEELNERVSDVNGRCDDLDGK